MEIRKPLILVGLVLSLATIACDIAFGQGQSNETEAAWAAFSECVENERASRASAAYDEVDQYQDCFPRLSVEELDAIRDHDNCLVNPDCLVAVESALDAIDLVNELDEQATQDAKCSGLSKEECANLGSYWYTEVAVSNNNNCPKLNNRSQVSFTFSFEEGRLQNNHFSNSSREGYNGHTRIAENTYQFTYPDSPEQYTITFSQNGFVETVKYDRGCVLTLTRTFVE